MSRASSAVCCRESKASARIIETPHISLSASHAWFVDCRFRVERRVRVLLDKLKTCSQRRRSQLQLGARANLNRTAQGPLLLLLGGFTALRIKGGGNLSLVGLHVQRTDHTLCPLPRSAAMASALRAKQELSAYGKLLRRRKARGSFSKCLQAYCSLHSVLFLHNISASLSIVSHPDTTFTV